MNIENIYAGYAFAGNPLWITDNNEDELLASGEKGWFKILHRGAVVFSSIFSLPLRINVADFVDSVCVPVGEGSKGGVIRCLEDGHSLADRLFTFYVETVNNEISHKVSCCVLPGCVSRQNYTRLSQLGADIFKARFLADKGNFFMTSRTSSWLLRLRESELGVLPFLQDAAGSLSFTDRVSGAAMEFLDIQPGIYGVDLTALRMEFAMKHDILPSVIDVKRNGEFSCRLVIEAVSPARNRFRLKFRNSFGFFELLDLPEGLSRQIEPSEDEDDTFLQYNRLSGDYYKRNALEAADVSFSAGTGFRRPDELNLLAELLLSSEVYLLDYAPEPVAVIPSIEDFSHDCRPEVPQKFTLKLSACADDIAFMSDIAGLDDSRKPRVFVSQFSNKFN